MENSNEIPVLQPGHTYVTITDKVTEIPLTHTSQNPTRLAGRLSDRISG